MIVYCRDPVLHSLLLVSKELVHRLVEMRADVNSPYKIGTFSLNGMYVAYNTARYRLGKKTNGTAAGYHGHFQTPLMAAVMTGQYEGEGWSKV